MKALFSLAVVIGLLLLAGCAGPQAGGTPASAAEAAKAACITACDNAKAKGQDLSAGPCLSDRIAPDWVCDVAHWPRTAVDDQRENQCPAFGVEASHFAEVDLDCKFIRSY